MLARLRLLAVQLHVFDTGMDGMMAWLEWRQRYYSTPNAPTQTQLTTDYRYQYEY